MEHQNQYRITCNETVGPLLTWAQSGPAWNFAIDVCCARGYSAQLEGRTIFADDSILGLLVYPQGYIRLADGRVVGPWREQAFIDGARENDFAPEPETIDRTRERMTTDVAGGL